MDELPPAGWFEDPVDPSALRYWDGLQWTDQRTPKSIFPPPPPRRDFSDIGAWMAATFTTLGACRLAMVGYLAGSALMSYGFGLVALEIWGDLQYASGEWSGLSAGRVIATIALVLASAVVSIWLYVFATHQLYFGQRGTPPAILESLAASVLAMPRTIGWGLALVAGGVLAIGVITVLFAITPALGILGTLAGVVGVVWLAVKLAFFVVGCVAPARGRNPIESSFDVSAGRFWPALGRLSLLWVIGLAISFGVSSVTLPFVTSPDVEPLDEFIVTEDDEVVFADIGGLLEETWVIGPGAVVSSIPAVAATLVGLAATAALYADIHPPGRREA